MAISVTVLTRPNNARKNNAIPHRFIKLYSLIAYTKIY